MWQHISYFQFILIFVHEGEREHDQMQQQKKRKEKATNKRNHDKLILIDMCTN